MNFQNWTQFLENIKIENQAVWSFNIPENLKAALLCFDMKSNKMQNVILGGEPEILKLYHSYL